MKGHNMKTKNLTLAVLLFACIFSVCNASDLPPIEKMLPQDTLLLVKVDNFTTLLEQFKKTDLYGLYNDPSMQPFIANAKKTIIEKINEASESEILKSITDANLLPTGKTAFALMLNPEDIDKEPSIVFIGEWGEKIDKIKELTQKAAKEAVEEGATKKTEDYRGIDIIEIIKQHPPQEIPDWSKFDPNNPDKTPTKTFQPEPVKTYHCFIDGSMIGSNNQLLIKFVVAHIKGAASETLADNSEFLSAVNSVGPHHDLDIFFNIKQLTNTIANNDQSGAAKTIIANLGLDNVQSLTAACGVGREKQAASKSKMLLKINSPKKGIFKILDLKSDSIKIPGFADSKAYAVSSLNLDIPTAYEEVVKMVTAISPQAAAFFYMPITPPSQDGKPGISLKDGIIDHFGSGLMMIQNMNKPFEAKKSPTETLVAIGIKNRNQLEKNLGQMHSQFVAQGNSEMTREFLSHTIYLLDVAGFPYMPGLGPMALPQEGGQNQMPKLAFTITDTHLILGLEKAVEKSLRTLAGGQDESIESQTWYQNAKTKMPAMVAMANLQNDAASGELLWWMLKQNTQPDNPMAMGFPAAVFGEMFDAKLLPEYDAVKKYFGITTNYGISTPEGIYFESYSGK